MSPAKKGGEPTLTGLTTLAALIASQRIAKNKLNKKKGGDSMPADVTTPYTLLEDAQAQTQDGGAKKKQRKPRMKGGVNGDNSLPGGIGDSYMLLGTDAKAYSPASISEQIVDVPTQMAGGKKTRSRKMKKGGVAGLEENTTLGIDLNMSGGKKTTKRRGRKVKSGGGFTRYDGKWIDENGTPIPYAADNLDSMGNLVDINGNILKPASEQLQESSPIQPQPQPPMPQTQSELLTSQPELLSQSQIEATPQQSPLVQGGKRGTRKSKKGGNGGFDIDNIQKNLSSAQSVSSYGGGKKNKGKK